MAVALAQPLGHTAPDKLLNIGGVPPDPPRQAGIILAVLLDQSLEHGSLIDIRPNWNIERTFILDT